MAERSLPRLPRLGVIPKARRAPPRAASSHYCPNCSLPRRLLHFNGEIFQCEHCKSWWSAAFVAERKEWFLQGGPAGYDPETGYEAQDI